MSALAAFCRAISSAGKRRGELCDNFRRMSSRRQQPCQSPLQQQSQQQQHPTISPLLKALGSSAFTRALWRSPESPLRRWPSEFSGRAAAASEGARVPLQLASGRLPCRETFFAHHKNGRHRLSHLTSAHCYRRRWKRSDAALIWAMGVISGELYGLGILTAASASARAAVAPFVANMDVILILWTFVAVSHFQLAKATHGILRSSIAAWKKAPWRRKNRGYWRSRP